MKTLRLGEAELGSKAKQQSSNPAQMTVSDLLVFSGQMSRRKSELINPNKLPSYPVTLPDSFLWTVSTTNLFFW